jgi:metacaspase-1
MAAVRFDGRRQTISSNSREERIMARKALCIGINDYPGTRNDLSGCVNDANDWAAELAGRDFTVSRLLDGQATKAAMVSALAKLIASAAAGDTVVITYSGHGTWVPDASGDEPDGRDEALCPCDIVGAGPLLDDEIRILLDRRRDGVRILMLADSCHSGSVTRGDESDLDPGLPRARFMPLQDWLPAAKLPASRVRPKVLVHGLARSGGDLLLAGAADTEYSWDTRFQGRANGAFTYYALKTLRRGRPADYDSWFRLIGDYLPSTKLPQHPQIFGATAAKRFAVFA